MREGRSILAHILIWNQLEEEAWSREATFMKTVICSKGRQGHRKEHEPGAMYNQRQDSPFRWSLLPKGSVITRVTMATISMNVNIFYTYYCCDLWY